MFYAVHADKSTAIEQKLNDLESQAQYLADRGQRPLTWHEFQKQHADIKPEKRSFLGAVTGLSIGAALALAGGLAITAVTNAPIDPTLAWTGGIGLVGGGAIIGSGFSDPLDKREAQVKAYEQHLQAIDAKTASRGMEIERDVSNDTKEPAISNTLPYHLRNSFSGKTR